MAIFHRSLFQFASSLRERTTALLHLPRAIRISLNPETEHEARNVQAQLEHVRANLKLLDYALPFVGAAIVWVHGNRAPFGQMMATLTVAVLACGINEFFLLRPRAAEQDIVARTKTSAQVLSLATWQVMAAWGWFALSMWAPPGGDMFSLLILSCSLAVVTTMFSPHAAAAAGAFFAIALPIFVLEFMNSYNMYSPLFTLAFLYMVLMAVQSYTIHSRFDNAWHLEQDREDLIKKLRVAHEEAVAASKAKSEFLANMSHELRTPLNAIIGFSDIVRTKAFGDKADRYSEYGGFIHQSGHLLLSLIGNILDLAKIEAGRKVLQQEPIDLMSLVLDEARLTNEKAAAKGVSVLPLLPRSLPLLRADLHAVRQILANLLSNAVKFTPEGGRIEVSVVLNAAREIELCVSDTGIGIALEDHAHLFDRFGQGRPDITTAERGSGLGLPIVKGLVDMHGGRIHLASALGQGTSVTIVFPAASTLDSPSLRVA